LELQLELSWYITKTGVVFVGCRDVVIRYVVGYVTSWRSSSSSAPCWPGRTGTLCRAVPLRFPMPTCCHGYPSSFSMTATRRPRAVGRAGNGFSWKGDGWGVEAVW